MIRLITIILIAAFAVNAQVNEPPKTDQAPLSIGLVVDNSGSYRLLLDRVVAVVADFIDQKGGDDEIFLVTFVDTSKIILRQEFTHVKSDLHDAAENMFIEGGQTAILDALKFSAKQFADAPADRQRVIVLVSDGDERNSAAKIDEVVKHLKDEKIRVFAIGIADEYLNAKFLDRITRETGGEKFIPKTRADAAAVAKQVWPAIRKIQPPVADGASPRPAH